MSSVEKRRSPVDRQLEAYEESWKKDHAELQACWAWEDTIAVGIATHSLIERADRTWRDRVFRGTEAYSEESNTSFRSHFERWLGVTEDVLAQAARLQKTYGTVEGVPELRQASENVRGHLANWQPPRLSSAVGLREMVLSPQAADELDRILDVAKQSQAEPPRPKMEELSAAELRERKRA
jgi:hypothetical protein